MLSICAALLIVLAYAAPNGKLESAVGGIPDGQGRWLGTPYYGIESIYCGTKYCALFRNCDVARGRLDVDKDISDLSGCPSGWVTYDPRGCPKANFWGNDQFLRVCRRVADPCDPSPCEPNQFCARDENNEAICLGAGTCTETQGYANDMIAGGQHYTKLNGKQGCKEKCDSMPNCACYAGKSDGYCHTGDATQCSNMYTSLESSDWSWGKCTRTEAEVGTGYELKIIDRGNVCGKIGMVVAATEEKCKAVAESMDDVEFRVIEEKYFDRTSIPHGCYYKPYFKRVYWMEKGENYEFDIKSTGTFKGNKYLIKMVCTPPDRKTMEAHRQIKSKLGREKGRLMKANRALLNALEALN